MTYFVRTIWSAVLLWGLVCLWSCASQKPQENSPDTHKSLSKSMHEIHCSMESFRGMGMSSDYNQALELSISQIASQVHSNLKASHTLDQRQDVRNGDEVISTSYTARTEVVSRLENREDVHVVKEIWQGDSVGVVSCMSRYDAAKPYKKKIERYREVFASSVVALKAEQLPRERVKLYSQVRGAYSGCQESQSILLSLGVADENLCLEQEYTALMGEFDQFMANWKIYYAAPLEREIEKAVYEELQKKTDLAIAESCTEGLVLTVSLSDVACGDGSFGVSCSQQISLEGLDCSGNKIFSLGATLKGVGKDGEEDAKKRLVLNLKKGGFWTEWFAELEKWSLK